MEIPTQILAEAGRQIAVVLVDTLQILNVGDPVTEGIHVTRALSPAGEPVPGLVQTTTLENAVESRTSSTYSVKVARTTDLRPGQAVRVLVCRAEPALVNKVLFIDKVSLNGLVIIRKGVASDYEAVDQQGKTVLV